MIPSLRLTNQQLINPAFTKPEEVISWMGAIQGQDYAMAKWAIGIRSESINLQDVNKAINEGKIIRTHLLRPTWHLVTPEDIRWMLKLSGQRIRSANLSYSKVLNLSAESYIKCNKMLEKILEGNTCLTKQEIHTRFIQEGLDINISIINSYMLNAESEGVLCSGEDKGNKPTYALFEERIPPQNEISKEEALAKLAIKYFHSHSPATLQDFTWWSGLSNTEAKQAIHHIDSLLIKDKVDEQVVYIYSTSQQKPSPFNIIHYLPSYDEYLISYKNRSAVLHPDHNSYAFTNYGIFYPVIMHNGKAIGNWKKTTQKKEPHIATSFFINPETPLDPEMKYAENKYRSFISQ